MFGLGLPGPEPLVLKRLEVLVFWMSLLAPFLERESRESITHVTERPPSLSVSALLSAPHGFGAESVPYSPSLLLEGQDYTTIAQVLRWIICKEENELVDQFENFLVEILCLCSSYLI